jgi:hypothetical protein
MREATTQSKADYFRLPRPLWRKLKKCLPKKKRKSRRGGRPRASDRAVVKCHLVRAVDGMPVEGRAPRLVRGLRKRGP